MGVIHIKSLVAATAIANYDLIGQHELARVNYERVIVAQGCTGSTAAGDFIVSLKVGGREVEEFINTATGVAVLPANMLALRARVPAGELVQAIVIDAANTNAVSFRLVFVP